MRFIGILLGCLVIPDLSEITSETTTKLNTSTSTRIQTTRRLSTSRIPTSRKTTLTKTPPVVEVPGPKVYLSKTALSETLEISWEGTERQPQPQDTIIVRKDGSYLTEFEPFNHDESSYRTG